MSAAIDIEALNALARSAPPSQRCADLPPPSHFFGRAANDNHAPPPSDPDADFALPTAAPDFLGEDEFVGLWLTIHMGLQGLISAKSGVTVPLADHAMTQQGLEASKASYDLICQHEGARRFLLSKKLGVMGSALPIILHCGTLLGVTKEAFAARRFEKPVAANDDKAPIFKTSRGEKS